MLFSPGTRAHKADEPKCLRYGRIGPRLCNSVNQERIRGLSHRCENCYRGCRGSCPFRKRLLPILRHLENFWPIIESVSIKRKKIVTQGRTWTSNADLSYPKLSPLPLLNTTTPTRQNSEKFKLYTSKLSSLTVTSMTGDPSPFRNF